LVNTHRVSKCNIKLGEKIYCILRSFFPLCMEIAIYPLNSICINKYLAFICEDFTQKFCVLTSHLRFQNSFFKKCFFSLYVNYKNHWRIHCTLNFSFTYMLIYAKYGIIDHNSQPLPYNDCHEQRTTKMRKHT
jgi:hypothetical protein